MDYDKSLDLKILLKSTILTDGILTKLAKERIGKFERPGVFINGKEYYVNKEDEMSLRPMSKFSKPSVEEMLAIISKYDSTEEITRGIIDTNIHSIMMNHGIPPHYKQWFTNILTYSYNNHDVTDRSIPIHLPYLHNTSMAILCDLFAKALYHMYSHEISDIVVPLTGEWSVRLSTTNQPGRIIIGTKSTPDVAIRYTPGENMYLYDGKELEPQLYMPIYVVRNREPNKYHVIVMVAQLVNILENISDTKRLVENKVNSEIKLREDEKVYEYIVIEDGKLYNGDKTINELYRKSGTPLTLENIALCKDAVVIIKGDVSETITSIIKSIAHEVIID